MRLVKYELKKIFTKYNILIVLGILLIQSIYSAFPRIYEHEYSDEIYKRFLMIYQGEFTQEKYDSLCDRQNEIDIIISQHDEYVQNYYDDIITLEEFSNYNDRYTTAKTEEKTVNYLVKKSEYYSSTDESNTFFYDTNWEDFLSFAGKIDWAFLLFIFAIIASVFGNEYIDNSISVILSSKNGRSRTAIFKVLIAACATFGTYIIIAFIKLLSFYFIKDMSNGDMPLYNLMYMNGYGNISIQNYYIVSSLLKAVSWTVIALAICMISILMKNRVYTTFISFVLIILPALVEIPSNAMIVFSGSVLNVFYTATFPIIIFVIISLIKGLIYSIVTVGLWSKNR